MFGICRYTNGKIKVRERERERERRGEYENREGIEKSLKTDVPKLYAYNECEHSVLCVCVILKCICCEVVCKIWRKSFRKELQRLKQNSSKLLRISRGKSDKGGRCTGFNCFIKNYLTENVNFEMLKFCCYLKSDL